MKNSFELFPNPSGDEVHLYFNDPSAQKAKIELLDLNGRVLQEFPASATAEFKLDLSSLPANLYWVKVGQQVKQLVRD